MKETIGELYSDGPTLLPAIFASMNIEIKKFLTALVSVDSDKFNKHLVNLLLSNGTKFKCPVLKDFPKDLPKPRRTAEYHCHGNSVFYAFTLMNHLKGNDSELEFASGMYRWKSINPDVTKHKAFISAHTWLMYKGEVLDCTMINHPPKFYEVVEYFGIRFPIKPAIREMKKWIIEVERNSMTPLHVLQNIKMTSL